ncbi:hypothetical protein BVX98_05580, partial [bacterium F11]
MPSMLLPIPNDLRFVFASNQSRLHGIDGIRLFVLHSPNKEYIVHCRSGARSAKAIRQLQQIGFKKLKNLKGGINALADLD